MEMAKKGYCLAFKSLMSSVCRKSCNLCCKLTFLNSYCSCLLVYVFEMFLVGSCLSALAAIRIFHICDILNKTKCKCNIFSLKKSSSSWSFRLLKLPELTLNKAIV